MHLADGTQAGTANGLGLVHPARRSSSATARRLRGLDVVPFDEEDESPFVGLLQVEA